MSEHRVLLVIQYLHVEICDIAGRTVETWRAASLQQNGATTINVSALPQGVYMLKIYTNKGVVAKKVVKE